MKSDKKIGRAIHNKRLSLNMTMDYVASKANISRATLSALENGSTKISLNNLLSVLNVLDMEIVVNTNSKTKSNRDRATRMNTVLNKKINDFIIMSIEQYAESINKSSSAIYEQMVKNNVIEEFQNDYEDLHGMSTNYLNNYISSLMGK